MACQAIFDDFRLIQGGKNGVWLGLVGCCATCSPMHPGQMSISPTQKQVKRAKIEPKHLNPADSSVPISPGIAEYDDIRDRLS